MRLVAISDTHGLHRELSVPAGDVLIHAGDMTENGEKAVTLDCVDWLSEQSHSHKILIAGNHDRWAESNFSELHQYAQRNGVEYLQDSAVEIAGVRFWGSPYTPRFMDWAFMLASDAAAASHWNLIPDNVDVLVTHGPSYGVLDSLTLPAPRRPQDDVPVARQSSGSVSQIHVHVGCQSLARMVESRKPSVHIFGHIHESFGFTVSDTTCCVNACVLDEDYALKNPATVVSLRGTAVNMSHPTGDSVSSVKANAALSVPVRIPPADTDNKKTSVA